MRRTLATLLVLTFLSPIAAAWPWDPTTVTVADSRAGDRYRYDLLSTDNRDGPDGPRRSTVLIFAETPTTALDAFGIERAAEPYVIQHVAANGTLENARRCYAFPGGSDVVRTEPLSDGWGSWSNSASWRNRVAGVETERGSMEARSLPIAFFGNGWPCEMRNLVGGRTFVENERVRIGDLMDWVGGAAADARSAPAREATFHGRTALRLDYDLAQLRGETDEPMTGTFRVTVADGLPGVALVEVEGTVQEGDETITGRFTHALTGIEAGDGPAFSRFTGAKLPGRNPDATFVDWRPGFVPADGLGIRYPFGEALADARSNAGTGLAEWLADHPKAYLAWVWYSRDVRGTNAPVHPGGGEGLWWFGFVDGAEGYRAWTTRNQVTPATGPLAALAPAGREVVGGGRRMEPEEVPQITTFPASSVDGATIARLATAHGVREVAAFGFGFTNGGSSLYAQVGEVDPNAGDEGTREGRTIYADATTGGLWTLSSTQRTSRQEGILDPLDAGGEVGAPSSKLSTLSALAGPGVGMGLGVGAATSLAVLVVLAKFLLFPLFTRLRRDRLLDNPVRARLYERVRAEPGIHRAELVDFLGIGEGATRHHVEQLVKHRLVVELRDEGFVRYFAAGDVPPEMARREAVLRAGSVRAVYDLLAREPRLSLRQAADRLGMSAPSVHRARKKLEKAGLLPAAPAASGHVAEA